MTKTDTSARPDWLLLTGECHQSPAFACRSARRADHGPVPNCRLVIVAPCVSDAASAATDEGHATGNRPFKPSDGRDPRRPLHCKRGRHPGPPPLGHGCRLHGAAGSRSGGGRSRGRAAARSGARRDRRPGAGRPRRRPRSAARRDGRDGRPGHPPRSGAAGAAHARRARALAGSIRAGTRTNRGTRARRILPVASAGTRTATAGLNRARSVNAAARSRRTRDRRHGRIGRPDLGGSRAWRAQPQGATARAAR